jgi:hypothetical protein
MVLLDDLFALGHKVPMFSQFVTILGVIEVSRSWPHLVPCYLLMGGDGAAGLHAGSSTGHYAL